mgnify:CR=1 FL=1
MITSSDFATSLADRYVVERELVLAIESVAKRLPFDEGHDIVEQAVDLTRGIDRHDHDRDQDHADDLDPAHAPNLPVEEALKGAPSICNDYYLMNQIKNGTITQPSSTDWVTSKGYFPGLTG